MANKINQIEIDSIIYDLQDKDAKAPFTGTKAEVQLAIAAGEIKEGDIVNITDDINDYPGGGDYPSGASNIVYLTQEQYDALPDDKLTDDIEYRIMDEGFEATAVNIGYDNSKSGLSAETLQEAVDELSRRPGGGGGESNIVYLTQEQYDELPDSKLTDGVEYRVTDAGVRGSAENVSYDGSASGLKAKNVQEAVDAIAAGAGNKTVYLTQEEYNALPADKLTDNVEYFIQDGETPIVASNVGYNGTTSGIDAVNVQQAIDKISEGLGNVDFSFTLIADSGEFTTFPNYNTEYDFANSKYKEYCIQAMFFNGAVWMSAMLTLPKEAVIIAQNDGEYEYFPNIYQNSQYNISMTINFRSNCVCVRTKSNSGWNANNYRLKIYAR